MGVRIEWARIRDLHLVTDPEDCTDEHGSTLDPRHIGLAAGGCVIEGTPAEIAGTLRALLSEVFAMAPETFLPTTTTYDETPEH